MSDSDFIDFSAEDLLYLCPRCLGRRDDGTYNWDVPVYAAGLGYVFCLTVSVLSCAGGVRLGPVWPGGVRCGI